MTWNATGVALDGEVEVTYSGELTEEENEQFLAANKAAAALVNSGCLGDPEGKYFVSITGHANPDHTPVSGWSNDHLSISLSQTDKEVTA